METAEYPDYAAPSVVSHSASEGLALVLESADAGYYDQFLPPDGAAFISKSWLKLLGLTPAEAPPADQFRAWLLERVHPDDRQRLTREYQSFLAGQSNSYSVDVRIRHRAGRWVWIQGVVRAVDVDAQGHVRRVIGLMQDITKRKQSEERRDLLIKELHHRAKNMLALIQALAIQTFKRDADPQEALAAFNARLAAIAAAQSLLIAEPTDSIDFARIAADIAGRCANRQIRIGGPTVLLSPPLAMTMAMALNELYTNAVKYGALSADTGTVTLFWQVLQGAEPSLKIEWREQGGPTVQMPRSRGFGSTMIERSLSQELNGSVSLDFHPDGVVCSIVGPLPTVCRDGL